VSALQSSTKNQEPRAYARGSLPSRRQFTRLATKRIATKNTHGTGRTVSSAIAAGFAKGLGLDLVAAVREAKAYISAAIAVADRVMIGSGRGPAHHFHVWWQCAFGR
jgi:hydroxymethylpyrimidine/phosphomethylpyrimidine kinase